MTWIRLRRMFGGTAGFLGVLMLTASVAAAAQGMQGFADVAEFLASLGVGFLMVWFGWGLTE